jgi:hypothetical protein
LSINTEFKNFCIEVSHMRKDKELGLLEHWGMDVGIFLCCSVIANIVKTFDMPSSESYYFA